MYEQGYLSVVILLPLKQYITSIAMPNFSSTNPETRKGLVVVLNALKCKLPSMECDWLENESELFTLDDIRKKMAELSDAEVYGVKRIKQKLQDKYKDDTFLLGGRTFCVIETWPVGS